MTSQIEDEHDLSLQSTRWMDRLQDERNASETDRRAFFDWATSSPAAAAQVVSDLVLDDVMLAARPWARQTREERIALARAAVAREDAAEVSNAANDDGGAAAGLRRRLSLAMAAAVVMAVVGLAVVWMANSTTTSSKHYAALNAADVITLADGTRVSRGARTEIDARIGAGERYIRMGSGEAEFQVFPDKKRRFSVETPHGTVVAVGTVFRVAIKERGIELGVTEGRVELVGRLSGGVIPVAAGEQASVLADGKIRLISRPKGANIASVRPTTAPHVFTRASLVEIARAFNAHQGRKVIDVRGSACLVMISAVLDLADPEDFVSEIRASAALAVDKKDEVIVIRGSKDDQGVETSCEVGTG